MKSDQVLWTNSTKEKLMDFHSDHFTADETYHYIVDLILETEALLLNPVLGRTYQEEVGEFKDLFRVVVRKFKIYYQMAGTDIVVLAVLQVIDLNGTVLFDSEDENAAKNLVTVDTEALVHYDADFLSLNPGMVRFAFPIVINEKQAANAVFVLPNNELFKLKGSSPLSLYWPLLAGGLLMGHYPDDTARANSSGYPQTHREAELRSLSNSQRES